MKVTELEKGYEDYEVYQFQYLLFITFNCIVPRVHLKVTYT